MANITNQHFSNSYNLNDYLTTYKTPELNNSFNKVQLNNNYQTVAKVLNLKHIRDLSDVLDQNVSFYKENIEGIKSIRDAVAENPPIKNRGVNVALKKFDVLMTQIEQLNKDLDLIPNSSTIISRAQYERDENLDSTIRKLESFVKMEETEKANNEENANKSFGDYWWDGVKDIFS